MSTWDRIEEEVHDWQTSDSEARAQAAFNAARARARAEALEEAGAHIRDEAAKWRLQKQMAMASTLVVMAEHIEARGRAPAPTTIPVERLLKAMDTAWMSTRQKHELLTDLGVDLDAEVATPADASHTCAGCRHRIHVPNCCLGDKGECDCGWVP